MAEYPAPDYLPIFNEIDYPTQSDSSNISGEITDLTVSNLKVLTPQTGEILKCDVDGFMRYNPPASDRTITMRTDADDNSPWESTTLYEAVQKVYALDPAPTQANPGCINIMAGQYTESKQIIIDNQSPDPENDPSYFCINGPPQYSVARLNLDTALPANEAWIDIQIPLIELTCFYLEGLQNCDYVIKGSAAAVGEGGQSLDFYQVWTSGANLALLWFDGATAYEFSNVFSMAETTPLYCTLLTNGAESFRYSSTIYPDGDFTAVGSQYIRCIDSTFTYQDDTSFGNSNALFFYADNSTITLNNIYIKDFAQVFEMSNNSKFISSSCRYQNNTLINNTYDATCFWATNSDAIDSSAVNLDALTASNSQLLYNDTNLDSVGVHFIGKLVSGLRATTNDSNAWFGQGSSELNDFSALKYNGTTFTDVTTNLKPSGSTPTALFSTLALNSAFYVGDGHPFGSIVFDISTIINGTNIILEYWNGASWATLNFMFSKTDEPYQPYANSYFSVAETQTCRVNIMILQGSNWPTTTVNGLTGYWVRFRLTGAITTSPIVDSILLYGNTSNITKDGLVIHHGKSRTLRNIPWDYNLSLGNPTNATMYFSTNIFIERVNNSFSNAGTQAISFAFACPTDLDSSCPLTLRLQLCSATTTASQGDFNFTWYISNVPEGTLYQTTAPGASTLQGETSSTFNITPNAVNGRNMVFYTSPNIYLPYIKNSNSAGGTTDMIICKLLRNSGANTASCVVAQLGLYYTSYRTTQVYVQ